MITAIEALRLPSAKLTDEQSEKATDVINKIDAQVRMKMTRGGLTMILNVTDQSVLAHVAILLKQAGWNPQWMPVHEQSSIRGAQPKHVGFQLTLAPQESAYEAAEQLVH